MPAKQRNQQDKKRMLQNPGTRDAASRPTRSEPQRDPSLITAQVPTRDPSLPIYVPTSSKDPNYSHVDANGEKEVKRKFWTSIYDKKNKTFCSRTCKSWFLIIGYSIMYLMFLSSYTMIFLFGSLKIIKDTQHNYNTLVDKRGLNGYPDRGIGLTATPTSEHNNALIWYPNGKEEAYQKYVSAIDGLLRKRRKRDVMNASTSDLGPCGSYPYGYGEKPCVIIRVNKQKQWQPKPLEMNSTITKRAPPDVKKWLQKDKKLWLHCSGYHSYDKEHIGSIKYYPDPPGFDPNDFPYDVTDKTPLIAIQISEFSFGISLTIRCQLWYDLGPSTIDFLLYVSQERRVRLKAHIPGNKYRRK